MLQQLVLSRLLLQPRAGGVVARPGVVLELLHVPDRAFVHACVLLRPFRLLLVSDVSVILLAFMMDAIWAYLVRPLGASNDGHSLAGRLVLGELLFLPLQLRLEVEK